MSRVLLSVLVLVFFVLCALAMRWGWRNRQRRQAAYLPAFPQPPAEFAAAATDATAADTAPGVLTGVYVGTTTAGDWLDRIVLGDVGHRSRVTVRLSDKGLLLDRVGESPLWIPVESIVAARTDRALAGTVVGMDGLLVVRWRLGDHELDSGVRGDDRDSYGAWLEAINAANNVRGGS